MGDLERNSPLYLYRRGVCAFVILTLRGTAMAQSANTLAIKPRASHIFEREEHEHYVEPLWCSQRLFDVEKFHGDIFDPACGFGRIPESAMLAGYCCAASDIVDRGYKIALKNDFFTDASLADNIVSNPPFDCFREFALHALELIRYKLALIWLVRTLPAARWLADTPLRRIYLLTPRPSMPPGHTITAGSKPSGGTQDFCWLIWERGYVGAPEVKWLHRDGAAA